MTIMRRPLISLFTLRKMTNRTWEQEIPSSVAYTHAVFSAAVIKTTTAPRKEQKTWVTLTLVRWYANDMDGCNRDNGGNRTCIRVRYFFHQMSLVCMLTK